LGWRMGSQVGTPLGSALLIIESEQFGLAW
jgi:hypothetical protein